MFFSTIGRIIFFTFNRVALTQVKIGVEAPKDVKVFRQEVFDAIQKENKAAVVDSQESDNEKAISAVSALSKLLKK